MRFLGEYRDQIENGKVDFPWEIPNNEKLTWLIAEITKDNLMSIYCEICNSNEFEKILKERKQHIEEIKIISHGELFLDVDERWQVPEDILKYLKTDEITFLGAFNFVEIFSAEDMKKYEKLLAESEELLKVTAIEEKFYDECRK